MNEAPKLPPVDPGDILCQSMETGQAWIPIGSASEIQRQLTAAQQQLRDAYQCMQAIEGLMSGG